ncbi:maleylpyruvate isomerase family mycothiol-dependent enzyme [Geodermatophilus sp. DF01-2]|uniref:maleylpyruvate isomerase family mycothiol-dependent enzyme n=1 Tax=Geodermatophilus sp. DF01-2 TaxID=2559610 RepID=UPI001ADDD447|nr:maleylpyruvate isomerase family mycothiol-dependent enzyme [Geodermatophilus sp. DF01_2]
MDSVDEIEERVRAQQRVTALVQGLPVADAERRVPACPAWTVRDLLAHVVGLDADVLAGDEPDDHNATWTQSQVDTRRDRDLATLLSEWAEMTGPMRAWMAGHGTRPLGDVVIHEQDLRGALDVPGARDAPAWAVLRERFARRLDGRVADAGLPPVALAGDTWTHGDPDTAGLVLHAPDFDLARALVTRRSAGQLRSWCRPGT